jgi:hypothetical protein
MYRSYKNQQPLTPNRCRMMSESNPNVDESLASNSNADESFGLIGLSVSGDGPSQLDVSVNDAEDGAKAGGRAGRGRAAAREGTKFYTCRVSDMVRWHFGHYTPEEKKEFKSGEARRIAAVVDVDGDRVDVGAVEPGGSVALEEFKKKMKCSVVVEEEVAWWSSCVRHALQELCCKHGVARVKMELSRRGADGKWSAISSPRVVVEYGTHQPQPEQSPSSSASSSASSAAAAVAAEAAAAAATSSSSSSSKLTKEQHNQQLIDHFLQFGVSMRDSSGDLLPEEQWQPSPFAEFAYPSGVYYVREWQVLQRHSFFSRHPPPTSGRSKE